MIKRFFSIIFAFLLLFSIFSCLSFATDISWNISYFNKLIEIGEKPGFIRTILTGKDNNGFYSKTICYALNDYNQDSIPELIVYGTNSSNEAGDNYQIYTFHNGEVKKFKIISHNGPWSENVTFSDQPYWPYYTNFFFLPDGYIDQQTNELIWIMKTEPSSTEFWAIAGTPSENETVFEAIFDFNTMTIEIVPIIFSEKTGAEEYLSKLHDWKENYKLTISHDEYGRIIPNDNQKLWDQISEADKSFSENHSSNIQTPKIKLKNKLLILRNNFLESEIFWIIGFYLLFVFFIIIVLIGIKDIIKNFKIKNKCKIRRD